MTDETKRLEDTAIQAKNTLLLAIIEAAPGANKRGADGLESLAKAYAAVAGTGPMKGEVSGQ